MGSSPRDTYPDRSHSGTRGTRPGRLVGQRAATRTRHGRSPAAGTEPLGTLIDKLAAYAELATVTGHVWPVLFWLHSSHRERHLD
ncbi:hypothetical protein [Dactylosporangium sp. CA-233914]|uniref:hypothetical protein n=1 Tax=Dactylosporangium sp. CA-233914 TaxID=3239934 RepID=UPI003D936DAC